jgi:hypothetical protein
MQARSSYIRSRTTTLLVVAAAHGLVFWVIWRIQAPQLEETETFTSTLFLVPATSRDRIYPARTAPRAISGARHASLTPAEQSAPVPQAPDATPAVTRPPAVPGAGVDWYAQLTGAADSTLRKAQQAHDQSGILTRKYRMEADPLNPGRTAHREFRWYDAGIHRIDTRALIPGLWLNDHCVLIAFVMPACKIGHIEIHDDLFKNMFTVLEENETAARPNDAP